MPDERLSAVPGPGRPPSPGDPAPRRRPDPIMLARGFDAAADVLLSALKHTGELHSADLTVAGGDEVRIVCVAEVDRWLTELAERVRAGKVL